MASEAAAGAAAGAWGGQGLGAGRCYHPHAREGGFWLFGEQGAGEHPALGGKHLQKVGRPGAPEGTRPRRTCVRRSSGRLSRNGVLLPFRGGRRAGLRPASLCTRCSGRPVPELAVRSSAPSAIPSGARSQLWGEARETRPCLDFPGGSCLMRWRCRVWDPRRSHPGSTPCGQTTCSLTLQQDDSFKEARSPSALPCHMG